MAAANYVEKSDASIVRERKTSIVEREGDADISPDVLRKIASGDSEEDRGEDDDDADEEPEKANGHYASAE